jgi:integrase/recombinase XerD
MKTATVKIFLDTSHPRKDGKVSISIRVTYNQRKKYYPTGISIEPDLFGRLMQKKRKNDVEQSMYNRIHLFYEKALGIVSKMEIFSFPAFDDRFRSNKDAANDLISGFNDYIYILESEDKINTSIGYRCAIRSLLSFKSNLTYADISPDFLREYVAKMKREGKSEATIGMYLRYLRSIMNRAKIDSSLYPFGRGKGKFIIPSGSKKFKRALTKEEINTIYNYTSTNFNEIKARDYFIFMYLSNGMNVRDFCNLKWKDYNGETINFIREKSKNSKKNNSPIIVSVKPEIRSVISKWGVPSVHSDSYIFPYLRTDMTAIDITKKVQLLTKYINKYLKRVCKNLSISKDVTSYTARHSFATILKNDGSSVPFISESLGHSSIKTTDHYFSSFELEQIHQETEKLRFFAKK